MDTVDPRIALMQKWSLENPGLMAQAGFVGGTDGSLQTGEMTMGTKFSKKKAVNAIKNILSPGQTQAHQHSHHNTSHVNQHGQSIIIQIPSNMTGHAKKNKTSVDSLLNKLKASPEKLTAAYDATLANLKGSIGSTIVEFDKIAMHTELQAIYTSIKLPRVASSSYFSTNKDKLESFVSAHSEQLKSLVWKPIDAVVSEIPDTNFWINKASLLRAFAIIVQKFIVGTAADKKSTGFYKLRRDGDELGFHLRLMKGILAYKNATPGRVPYVPSRVSYASDVTDAFGHDAFHMARPFQT